MSCYLNFVNETKDIGDLAKCYGATEGRRDGALDGQTRRVIEMLRRI